MHGAGNRLTGPVIDLERVDPSRDVDIGAPAEKGRQRLRLQRRRHHDQPQVVPRLPRLPRERQPQIGVNASLVEFIEHDGREIREERVLLQPRRQDPFGRKQDARV